MVACVAKNPGALAYFGYDYYQANRSRLRALAVQGSTGTVLPSVESVQASRYLPLSRPLFFYVKKAHIGVIPGLKEYASFFIADEIAGPDGPLSAYGLVADPDLATTQAAVSNETAMGSN